MDKWCPTEDVEEAQFSSWCDHKGLTHWHVPQETYTTSWKQKAHNRDLGVKAGVSDHWVKIDVPFPPANDRHSVLLVIEFKRQFGNIPTDEQIKFIHEMEEIPNVTAVCCYGCDEAIKVVEELERGKFDTFDKCTARMLKIEENRKKRAKNRKNSKNDLPY